MADNRGSMIRIVMLLMASTMAMGQMAVKCPDGWPLEPCPSVQGCQCAAPTKPAPKKVRRVHQVEKIAPIPATSDEAWKKDWAPTNEVKLKIGPGSHKSATNLQYVFTREQKERLGNDNLRPCGSNNYDSGCWETTWEEWQRLCYAGRATCEQPLLWDIQEPKTTPVDLTNLMERVAPTDPVDVPPIMEEYGNLGRSWCDMGQCVWEEYDPKGSDPFAKTNPPHRRTMLTCADKTRFLMTSEDGQKHCIKLR